MPNPARPGPRPLALHLGIAASTWTSSLAALPSLRSGSLGWSPTLSGARKLEAELGKVAPEAFARALGPAVQRRMAALVAGIQAYRDHPYRRDLPEPPAVWRQGSTRLLDYGAPGADGPAVLVVPSLINRAYVLDLSERFSLLRWLARQGFRPYLVDWGRPGDEERGFSLTDYVAGRLESALDALLAVDGRAPSVVGYCMGGLLALALAERRPDRLAGLALLATPWDFHAEQALQSRLVGAALAPSEPLLEALGELPVDLIQGLFAALDPQLVPRKFLAFSRLDAASPAAADFVALEDWLNDGVPLAAPVARECLAGWYGANTPARGRWRISGRAVEPAALAVPSLCLIPAQDRIVPPASAAALAAALPGAETLTPSVGHIGMVVSARAQGQVWRPLARWLKARAGPGDRPKPGR
jgi:polyhydroxyalkanoate synthase